MISSRIQNLAPSATLSLDNKVKKMQATGQDIINFTVGEPDSNTPSHIQEAAIDAMHHGFTRYTPAAGITSLREAIATKLKNDNNIEYDPQQIIVGVGTKQLLYSAFQTICNAGDEVIVATPTWTTYIEQIKLAQGVPVLVPLLPPFRLKAVDIAPHINQKTKAIVLNSPANPTGSMIDDAELIKIAHLAVEKNVLIITDEIYEKITYSMPNLSIASLNSKVKAQTVTLNGFSKAYAMTGWRIGYAAGPQDIIDGMIALAGQTTSGTSSISQHGAVAALTGDQTTIAAMLSQFKQKRQLAYDYLKDIEGIDVDLPDGAFYIFPSIAKILKSSQTATDWASELLSAQQVAVVPGEAFEAPGYIRISYATSIGNLEIGLKKIKLFIQKNQNK